MAGTSPTQRTLKALKEQGYRCGIVERFVGPLNIRVDLFHIIDIIAIKRPFALDDRGEIVGVQSCGQAFAEHHRKLTEEHADAALDWLRAGGELELWGWRKVKAKRGGKQMLWKPRVRVYGAVGNRLRWVDGEGEDPSGAARASARDPDQAWDHDCVESDGLR